MKVTDVQIHVVNVPYLEPETWTFGRSWGLTSGIVEVSTDAGIVGLGELPGVPTIDTAVAAARAVGGLVIGEDPREITRFLRATWRHGWHHFAYVGNNAVAAIEMALWDILGKSCELPVSALLGGTVRATVPYYFYLSVPDRDPATARAQAAEGVRRGFRTLYLKIGFDVANDVALAQAVREEVGPDVAIRVDANEAWTVHEAAKALRAFEDVDLEFLEQPIDMDDIDGLALLRAQTSVPIGANQAAWLLHKVPQIIAKQAADVIVTDPHQLGSIRAFRDVAGMCEVARIPLVKHSFGDLGVTTAATLHVLGGLHGPVLAHQTHLNVLEHDLLAERLEFVDGALPVPARPGLGVDLDRDALAHYKAVYDEVGQLDGYGRLDAPSPLPAGLLGGPTRSS
jgi:L-alanine-DL-glutamate epimerase-like enolase superfamily enzyme